MSTEGRVPAGQQSGELWIQPVAGRVGLALHSLCPALSPCETARSQFQNSRGHVGVTAIEFIPLPLVTPATLAILRGQQAVGWSPLPWPLYREVTKLNVDTGFIHSTWLLNITSEIVRADHSCSQIKAAPTRLQTVTP